MKRYLMMLAISGLMLDADGGLLEVEWPKVDKQQTQMQKAYPPALREKIRDVTLPVYLPSAYIYNQRMSVVAEENFYTVTLYLDKARLMISGDRTYQESVAKADPTFTKMMKSQSVEFVHAEGMMMSDFNRHSVNYSLVLECDEPETDTRCTEVFLRGVYDQLIIVGGKR
ncbi:MAG TPA: hypothetical protein ENK86_00780 [Campylobacterales bacterium]|nr:hypothetical protein [Campylobacterales bacterium]